MRVFSIKRGCISLCLLLTTMTGTLAAQNAVTLKMWTQVFGRHAGQWLGANVSYLGKKNDSTLIGVGDGSDTIYVYQMKSPADTIPKFTLLGQSCVLGDFNGDGIQDVATGGNPTRIYLGKSPGVFDTIPSFVKFQEANGYNFGQFIAKGDINGDKCDDLIVSDLGYPNDDQRGRVYVFLGGQHIDTVASYIIDGDTTESGFGWNIASGDLNGDGIDDLIVRGLDQTGRGPNGTIRFTYLKIYLGGPSLSAIPWKTFKTNYRSAAGLACFDINGDGVKDLLWAAANTSSTVFVHFGGATFDSIPDLQLNDPGFGLDVIANAGDMNGDGYNDILIGSPGANQTLGMVLVYSGGPHMDSDYDAAAGLSVESYFGWSVTSVGDINGDSLADVAVGAPQYKWNEGRGTWMILLGRSDIPVASVKAAGFSSPATFDLLQNYPNPFNPTTTISYKLPVKSFVSIKVYDLLGRAVASLVNADQDRGEHTTVFDASRLASGVYVYELKAGNYRSVRKMMLTK